MTYEEIWQKIKRMKRWERKMLAYEMTLKGFNVGYIHPHYYFDAKFITFHRQRRMIRSKYIKDT